MHEITRVLVTPTERVGFRCSLYESDLKKYIINLTGFLFTTYKGSQKGIRQDLKIGIIKQGIDPAIPCSLIINELVSNALKYAYPEEIGERIQIKTKQGKNQQFILIVSGDGIGFPHGYDYRKAPSLGLKLVCSLVNQWKEPKVFIEIRAPVLKSHFWIFKNI